MEIEFKNGSKIQSLSSDENKRGIIRSKRLTDKEYRQMMFDEYVRTEERIDKVMKILEFK